MTKRPLTFEERQMTEEFLEEAKDDIDYLEYVRDNHQLMLDRGLRITHARQVKKYKTEISEVNRELEAKKKEMAARADHLANGVEIKEIKEVKNDG